MRALTAVRRRLGTASGFSLVEVLVALVIFLVVLAIMFSFFIEASQHAATEESALEAQQRARVALDAVERAVRQAGFGTQRDDSTDAGSWQHELIHAGAYTIAFNADLDESAADGEGIGALDTTQTIVIPGADGATYSYRGEGVTAAATRGAETHVFTIDADDDGEFTLADRTQVDAAAYNPAADTQVPLDFAVFHRTYGYRLNPSPGYDGGLEGLGAHLFTNAVDDDETRYPDGSSPHPLFVYILSEDLNGDGVLADGECVVGPCPPDDVRKPTLYTWGDGGDDGEDFDGELSDAEREALRTLPVGSEDWASNPLVDGSGDYFATTLSTAVAAGPDNVTISVADATNFLAGQYIRIGPSADADTDATVETIVIEDVNLGTNQIYLESSIDVGHGSGQEVRVLPRTLLRMVRAVEIHYDAVTPRIETRTPGRSGRKGTKGLDYRVRELVKKVELLNLTTAALPDPTPPEASEFACPLTLAGVCPDASALSSITVYLPQNGGPVPINFNVTNADSNAAGNVQVTFTNASGSVGTVGTPSGLTDGFGNVTASYVPAGIVGTDTLTAVAQCDDGSGLVDTDPAQVSLVMATISVNPSAACTNTLLTNGGTPVSIPFTITVSSSGGPMSGETLSMALNFANDPADDEYPPSFADVQGELIIGGTSQGLTDLMDGTFTAVDATTNASGIIAGQVVLVLDEAQAGVRLFLTVAKVGNGCDVIGSTLTIPFTFNRLELVSVPTPGCTSAVPCTIAAAALAPQMKAVLKRNGNPISGAAVAVAGTKVSGPANSTVRLVPPAGTTSAAGEFQFEVGHNNDPAVGAPLPLVVSVSASTTGSNVGCDSGTINSLLPGGGYQFNGSVASSCSTEILQAYFTKNTGRNYCLKVKNIGSCPVKITEIKQTLHTGTPAGPPFPPVNDATKYIKKITGGTIIPAGGAISCAIGASNVTLFDPPCNIPPGTNLFSGSNWTFLPYLDRCFLPPNMAEQNEYFVFPFIDWNNTTLTAGRAYHITIKFQCFGACSGNPAETLTVQLVVPA